LEVSWGTKCGGAVTRGGEQRWPSRLKSVAGAQQTLGSDH
jgi:hypothetical protein